MKADEMGSAPGAVRAGTRGGPPATSPGRAVTYRVVEDHVEPERPGPERRGRADPAAADQAEGLPTEPGASRWPVR